MSESKRTYNNLPEVQVSLPARDYYDPEIYDKELENIWYRNWVFACRADELESRGDYVSVTIGTQNIFLVKTADDLIKGYYNTCRHRGSLLCSEATGRFKGNVISCPYHRWAYSFDGELVNAPHLDVALDRSDYALYQVATDLWEGCVFVNLSQEEDILPLSTTFEPTADVLNNWHLDQLKVAHRYENRLHCNWKIFWENFLECYHCPGVHPELCRLVPIYGRTFVDERDDKNWEEHSNDPDPKYRGGMSTGNKSWTRDGQLHAEAFSDLSKEEMEAGYVFAQSLPSTFIVAHPDYVRMVSVLPDGPEHTRVKAEWFLSSESLTSADVDKIVEMGLLVIEEDAAVCELNQAGLKALPHKGGFLVPQEYDLKNFHAWVKQKVNE